MTTDQALQLTVEEQNDLRGCEAVIERGRKTFIEVGAALSEVRERRLYRKTHDTFEDYCERRWGLSHRHVNRLIEASAVVTNLGPMGPILPDTERQARALAAVIPEQRAEVWAEAVARNDGQPAPARLVAEVAAERDGGLMAFAMPELLDEPAGDRREDGTPIVRRNDLSALGSLMGRPQSPAPVSADRNRTPRVTSESNEWYTPARYVEAARQVLGGIDFDPASCAHANLTVKAARFETIDFDGLNFAWEGRVWLNPPYGVDDDGSSNQARWCAKLIESYREGVTTAAIVCVNALTYAPWFQQLWGFPICFTDHRIRFDQPAEAEVKKSPLNGTAFAYLGPDPEAFAAVFSQFGAVVSCVALPARQAERLEN